MNADLALALRLADAADAITLPRFRAAGLHVDWKPDGSPVSDADVDAEAALRTLIARERPGQAIFGEELGQPAPVGAADCWYLDPIDGTRNYVRGVPVWATLIALHREGQPRCAVVSAPALRRRWWAAAGDGAFEATSGRLRVSDVNALSAAYMSTTDGRAFATIGRGAGYAAVASGCRQVRAFGDFWSHMLVAEGAIDIALEPLAEPWDLAALQLVVEEAGGRFSDLDGARRIDGGGAVTSNGALHDTVIQMLAQDGVSPR